MLRLPQSGWTPLICAAESGKADCARLLLDAGAETDTHDEVRLDVFTKPKHKRHWFWFARSSPFLILYGLLTVWKICTLPWPHHHNDTFPRQTLLFVAWFAYLVLLSHARKHAISICVRSICSQTMCTHFPFFMFAVFRVRAGRIHCAPSRQSPWLH